jgi:hypothetical protein
MLEKAGSIGNAQLQVRQGAYGIRMRRIICATIAKNCARLPFHLNQVHQPQIDPVD